MLLSRQFVLLQQSIDYDPVRGHHVAPGSPGTVLVEHRFGYAQRFQRPSSVRLRVGRLLVRRGRRVRAPITVHRIVIEPALVRGRLAQPIGFEHLVHVQPIVGRRIQHGLCERPETRSTIVSKRYCARQLFMSDWRVRIRLCLIRHFRTVNTTPYIRLSSELYLSTS